MSRSSAKRNPVREVRIHDEIIVDACGPEEHAMGWYCSLDEFLKFPFAARCIARRATSPLKKREDVTVLAMLLAKAPDEAVVSSSEHHSSGENSPCGFSSGLFS